MNRSLKVNLITLAFMVAIFAVGFLSWFDFIDLGTQVFVQISLVMIHWQLIRCIE